jgi:hypothetical protein
MKLKHIIEIHLYHIHEVLVPLTSQTLFNTLRPVAI